MRRHDSTENIAIADEIDRLLAEVPVDVPLRGTRFVNDASAMLDATREIERTVRRSGGPLFVGFQDATRLDDELDVYRALADAGVSITAYGVGEPAASIDGLDWNAVHRDRRALHNQWFLIARGDEPIAFVGYETSPDDVYRQGRAGNEHRTWRGFVTDEQVVIDHLVEVLATSTRSSTAPPTQWYLAMVGDGTDPRYDAPRTAATEAAARDGAGVVLYDRSTESLLTTPYPSGPWSDEKDAVSAAWRLTPERLDSLGRRYLAEQLREVRERVPAIAHMADDTGATALHDAVARYRPVEIFLPAHLEDPSLLDRVRGNTVAALTRELDAAVRVVDADGRVRASA